MSQADGEQAALDGINDAIRRMTVGIVSGSGPQLHRGLGTGNLIRWGGRHLILTAEHVVEDTRVEDLRFFLPHDSSPRQVERETIRGLIGARTSALLPFSQLSIERIEVDRDVDVAAVMIDPTLDQRHSAARFHDLTPGGVTPSVGERVFSRGFPHDLTRVTWDDARIAFSYSEVSEVVAIPECLTTFDPARHFAVPFEERQDAHPSGMSGAARWFRRALTPVVWHPNIEIGGIVIRYDPASGITKNLKRQSIEAFLSARFPLHGRIAYL